jgi:hypothetical protein
MNSETIAPERLYGTWKLVAAKAVNGQGEPIGSVWGPVPMGRLVLTSGGRMMAVLCDGRNALPEGQKRAYSSYCGNYRIEGDTLITSVDAASVPARIGGEQRRRLALRNGQLILMPPAEANGEQRELFWEYCGPE